MQYWVQPRDQIFIKGYGFFSFAKNMGKNIGQNRSNGRYCQKLLDHDKQSATNALKTTSKSVIQKTAEAIGDLIGNKITNIISKFKKRSPNNNQRQLQMNMIKKYLNKDMYLLENTTNQPSKFKTKNWVE